MKRHAATRGILAFAGMLILILDSRTALAGAKEGMDLILSTVIPSLFPFFFLSIAITSVPDCTGYRFLRPAAKLFHLPDGAEHLLISSFLGGYPAGAQAVAQEWEQGNLTSEQAQKLLCFAGNAGPSFLFGILAPMFSEKWMAWALWMIHIMGALLAARLLPGRLGEYRAVCRRSNISLSQVLYASLKVTGSVCGWLLLFRILSAFLDRWVLNHFPTRASVFITGLLELTNGCCRLWEIPDVRTRFILASLFLSLGGLCVLLQTRSVTKGLNLTYYYKGKLIQCLFSVCTSAALLYRTALPLSGMLILIPVLRRKSKKEVEISDEILYNDFIFSEEAPYHAVS